MSFGSIVTDFFVVAIILVVFIASDRLLLGIRCGSYSFTGFYWVLLGFIGSYWVVLGFTGFLKVLLSFTGFFRVLPGFTEF